MYEKYEEVTRSLETAHGEADFEGVMKMINGIQEILLNHISVV
jgi:hypothetical protein